MLSLLKKCAIISFCSQRVSFSFNISLFTTFIFSFRKEGSLSGRHYHKGLSPYKNPEKIILVKGEITLNWFDVNTNKKGSEIIIGPSQVHIYPGIWHEIVAVTDFVVFEMNALTDGQGDTFLLD